MATGRGFKVVLCSVPGIQVSAQRDAMPAARHLVTGMFFTRMQDDPPLILDICISCFNSVSNSKVLLTNGVPVECL